MKGILGETQVQSFGTFGECGMSRYSEQQDLAYHVMYMLANGEGRGQRRAGRLLILCKFVQVYFCFEIERNWLAVPILHYWGAILVDVSNLSSDCTFWFG